MGYSEVEGVTVPFAPHFTVTVALPAGISSNSALNTQSAVTVNVYVPFVRVTALPSSCADFTR